jgi:hypothetical protein
MIMSGRPGVFSIPSAISRRCASSGMRSTVYGHYDLSDLGRAM